MAKTRPGGLISKPKTGKRDLDSYTIRGTTKVVRVGDCVMMRPSDTGRPSYVARIEGMEADSRNNVKVRVRWYYRPEESLGGRRQFHGAKELFLSDHYDVQSAHTIEGKCIVHSFKNYTKLENVGAEDYYCRFEYKAATGGFTPDRVAVYCKCEMPYNPDDLMVQCEGCKDWYHPACVDMTIEEAKKLDHFVCSECASDDDVKRSQNGFSVSSVTDVKGAVSSLAHRRLSTSNVTSESTDGSFPSDLLSAKNVVTPQREIGLYQDLVIPVTNFHNEDKGLMVLAGDVFDVPIRKDIIHRVVRWQLAKRQQGTHSTKTISEVSGTGRKPYRQKGTGRARHGTLRGPQFRGGAVMHGPKPRSHAFKLNKKVRRLGLKIALTARAAEGKLLVFEDLEVPTHKTKNIVNYVIEMENTKKLLVVDGGPINEKLKLATQNLHYVNLLPSIGLNVYSILQHDTLVMSRDAVNKIVERMHTPIKR